MNSQLRAAELLRQAAAALTNSSDGPQPTGSTSSSTAAHSVQAAVRNAFAPYTRQMRGNMRCRGQAAAAAATSFWTHRFCVLSSTTQDTAPTREEKQKLFEAGLGEKKITFPKNDIPSSFKQVLEKNFPGLENCGGYELLRSTIGSRVSLEKLRMPSNGYTANYLASESNLGQACCYVRPIQRDINIDKLDNKHDDEMVFEECFECKSSIPLSRLRDHIKACTQSLTSDEEDESALPKLKRRKKQAPICQYMCDTDRDGQLEEILEQNPVSQKYGTCPICSKEFPGDTLAVHASNCGDGKNNTKMTMNLQEKISEIMNDMRKHDKPWTIKVVRRMFETTSIEQLEDGDEQDWERPLSVHFIGEEGIDAGGLTREFFSLLFKSTKVFEGNTFSVNPQLLDSKQYCLIGKAVAKAIISGHPGPRCLNQHVTRYILLGKEPDFANIKTEEICRADAVKAITDIEEATPETIQNVFNEHISTLEATGYSKILTMENKEEAIKTLKAFYLLYRPMAAINQFVEGLKIHGILQTLQQHPDDAAMFFTERSFPSADEVQAFFIPVFSKVEEERAKEEIIIYNWGKCLKNIEKGRISTAWFSLETECEEMVQLHIGHLLQALLGCPNLTPNLSNGLINFDHSSLDLPKINTCAPSITFSRTKHLQNYSSFQEAIVNVVVGAYGFGNA